VAGALAPALGRQAAHDLVGPAAAAASAGGPALHETLAAEPQVRAHLGVEEIRRLLEPAGYLGATGELIDRALRAHRNRSEAQP
jgi:3-carboxy-cis,cis-muconate cycloisomerase